MGVQKRERSTWLLLAFSLPAKRASKRVEIWRKLQRYGTVPLGNSGYLLPSDPNNEERFQWLATAIRRYGGEASVVRVESIDCTVERPILRSPSEGISGTDSASSKLSETRDRRTDTARAVAKPFSGD